jgi:hypothetical protein
MGARIALDGRQRGARVEVAGDLTIDGRPRIADVDRLLQQLRRVHGDAGRPDIARELDVEPRW